MDEKEKLIEEIIEGMRELTKEDREKVITYIETLRSQPSS